MKLYSIRSKSSGLYDTPFPGENHQRVVYELRHLINFERKSIISASPDDHELYCVGEFDSHTGELTAMNDLLLADLSVLLKKDGDNSVSNVV